MRILFTATLSTLGIFFVGRLAPPCQVSFGQRLCSAACSRRSQARPAHSRSLSLSTHSGRNILKIVNYTQRVPPSIDIPVSLTSLYLLQHSHLAMTLCENSYSSFCRPRSTSNRCSITMLRTFIQEPVCLYKIKNIILNIYFLNKTSLDIETLLNSPYLLARCDDSIAPSTGCLRRFSELPTHYYRFGSIIS